MLLLVTPNIEHHTRDTADLCKAVEEPHAGEVTLVQEKCFDKSRHIPVLETFTHLHP